MRSVGKKARVKINGALICNQSFRGHSSAALAFLPSLPKKDCWGRGVHRLWPCCAFFLLVVAGHLTGPAQDTTPKIYVACLASYNNRVPSGCLYGKWIDATQDE